MISISIVSHGQGALVSHALADLAQFSTRLNVEVLVTLNIHESLSLRVADYPWPVKLIDNPSPKGFGANHNAAFRLAQGSHFCVMNPDIRIFVDPFPVLLEEIAQEGVALAAPIVLSRLGQLEDSVRYFPTPYSLAVKALGAGDGRYPIKFGAPSFSADWVAGMFMLFRSEDFRAIGGFDEDFFLYYEDVDICVRLWRSGRRVLACPKVHVIHDARRESRRNLRYMRWHLASMCRFFWKHLGRLPITRGSTLA